MSYETLYQAWKKEKASRELQPIPPGLYAETRDVLTKIESGLTLADENSLRASLLKAERDNLQRLAKELIETRYVKLVRAVAEGTNVPSNLLAKEEGALYEGLVSSRARLADLVSSIVKGRESQERKRAATEQVPKRILVRFLQSIPAIIGIDMKLYGPFRAEDIAALPAENAEVFIKRGMAQKVDT